MIVSLKVQGPGLRQKDPGLRLGSWDYGTFLDFLHYRMGNSQGTRIHKKLGSTEIKLGGPSQQEGEKTPKRPRKDPERPTLLRKRNQTLFHFSYLGCFLWFEIFFVEIFHSRTPTRKDPSFQNQEKSREPLQNPNQLGQQLEILKSKKIEKSQFFIFSENFSRDPK